MNYNWDTDKKSISIFEKSRYIYLFKFILCYKYYENMIR